MSNGGAGSCEAGGGGGGAGGGTLTSDQPWGTLATNVPDPPACIAQCRQRFLETVEPSYVDGDTLGSVCEKLSGAKPASVSVVASASAATTTTTTITATTAGAMNRRRGRWRGGLDWNVNGLDTRQEDANGTGAGMMRFWQLYCCDQSLCGVKIEAQGQDPNVNYIISQCSSLDYHDISDPGPPEICHAAWIVNVANSSSSSSSRSSTAATENKPGVACQQSKPSGFVAALTVVGTKSATVSASALELSGFGIQGSTAESTAASPDIVTVSQGRPGSVPGPSFTAVSTSTPASAPVASPTEFGAATAIATSQARGQSVSSSASAALSPSTQVAVPSLIASETSEVSEVSEGGFKAETIATTMAGAETASSQTSTPSLSSPSSSSSISMPTQDPLPPPQSGEQKSLIPTTPSPSQTDQQLPTDPGSSQSSDPAATLFGSSSSDTPSTGSPLPRASHGAGSKSPASPSESYSEMSSEARARVAAIVTVVVALLVVAGLIFCLCRRRRRHSMPRMPATPPLSSHGGGPRPPPSSPGPFGFLSSKGRRSPRSPRSPGGIRDLIRHPGSGGSPGATSPTPLLLNPPPSASGNSVFNINFGGSERDAGGSFDAEAATGFGAPLALASSSFSSRRRSSTSAAPLTPPPRLGDRRLLSLTLNPMKLPSQLRDSQDPLRGDDDDLKHHRHDSMLSMFGPTSAPQSVGPLGPKIQFPSSPIFSPTASKLYPRHERAPKLYGLPFPLSLGSPGSTSQLLATPSGVGAGAACPRESLNSLLSNPASSCTAAASIQVPTTPPPQQLSPTRPPRPFETHLEISDLLTPHGLAPGPPPRRGLPAIPPAAANSRSSRQNHGDAAAQGGALQPDSRETRDSWGSWSVTGCGGGVPGVAVTTGPGVPAVAMSRKATVGQRLSETDLEHREGRY